MTKSKRTVAQTDAIVKSSATMMESVADDLFKIARAMESILGPTKAVQKITGSAGSLRMQARQSLARIQS